MWEEPFDVVHVDSHADLGLGNASGTFLQGEFLKLPIEARRRIRNYEFSGDIKGISIGDYLWDTLKDFHEENIWDKPVKNFIQLKYNKLLELPDFYSTSIYKKKYLEGAIKDPEVELLIIPTIEDVKFDGYFDYAVLAQSPNYTPASVDFIMDMFRDYIDGI